MPSSPVPAPALPVAAPAREYSLGYLLADVLRLSRTEFRQQSTGLRLTPALSRLLFYVDQRPGCSQAELASYLDLACATVGRMIDRLERRIALLPPGAGQRQVVIDNPPWLAVAEMLVRKL